jgi:hypothetical protein
MAFYTRRNVGIVALLMWIASLLLPVETDCGSPYPSHGYNIFAIGWLGALDMQFGWFANLFMLWVMGRLLFDRRPGIIPAIIGLGLALSAPAWKDTPTDVQTSVCERHSGFYLWIACAALLAFVALADFTMGPKLKSGEEFHDPRNARLSVRARPLAGAAATFR